LPTASSGYLQIILLRIFFPIAHERRKFSLTSIEAEVGRMCDLVACSRFHRQCVEKIKYPKSSILRSECILINVRAFCSLHYVFLGFFLLLTPQLKLVVRHIEKC